jgi:Icc-related predicted phosphoesterase
MKVLTVSDNVLPQLETSTNLRQVYGDVEAVISCGDMPADYLDFIVSVLNVPLLYVRGNHDGDYGGGHPGGEDLHLRIVTFRGLRLAGLEGCMRYNRGPVQYTELQMLAMVLKLAPRMLLARLRLGHGLDVMVTHAPARGIHDLPDQAHRGFRSFRLLIGLYRPRYLIHGHVDVNDRRRSTVTTIAGTEISNINPMKVLTFERRAPVGS